MRHTKTWLFGSFLLGALAGPMLLSTTTTQAQPGPGAERREERREERNYWRYHEGKWSHWDARDRRWYYTDGNHWYYHNGRGWDLYRFDKTFGRDNFERGGYVPPPPGNTTVILPNHAVYVGPR